MPRRSILGICMFEGEGDFSIVVAAAVVMMLFSINNSFGRAKSGPAKVVAS